SRVGVKPWQSAPVRHRSGQGGAPRTDSRSVPRPTARGSGLSRSAGGAASWAEAVEYRVEEHAAKLGGRHRSSVVELSIRNRAVVGSNPTGGSVFSALLLAFLRLPFLAPARLELLIDTLFDRR